MSQKVKAPASKTKGAYLGVCASCLKNIYIADVKYKGGKIVHLECGEKA